MLSTAFFNVNGVLPTYVCILRMCTVRLETSDGGEMGERQVLTDSGVEAVGQP